jgi:SAM-dependent methyltransferase
MADTAAGRWKDALAGWAIPEEILNSSPESPWGFPVELFASRADVVWNQLTPSNERALEALPPGGSVLDVGCGAGAASLRLVPPAGLLVGVDESPGMLAAFAERAQGAGVAATLVNGRWPDVADEAPAADVVVCHHVFYNAQDLLPFARRLTDHARRRVVVELTARHPMSNESFLWKRFHGIDRPTRPVADDAQEVLREAGLDPLRQDWEAPGGGGFETLPKMVAFLRRRLCLPADRDPEIAEAIEGFVVRRPEGFGFPSRPVVTLWWPGSAG